MQMNISMNMMNNSVLETDLAQVRRNAEAIVRTIPAGTRLLPVLKCDAYDLGAAEIARPWRASPWRMCPKGLRCAGPGSRRTFWS